MVKVLLVDDEDQFRNSLSQRLTLRGYENVAVDNGGDAIKAIRSDSDIDVIILDRKMPGLSGEQTLKEIKSFRPELQVIILTGFGDTESAVEAGKLDAFTYVKKPCDLDQLIGTIDDARQEKVYAMSRHEIAATQKDSLKHWLIGSHQSRPGLIVLACCMFAVIVFTPASDHLMNLLSSPKTGQLTDSILGYAGYAKMNKGETITDYYSRTSKIAKSTVDESGNLTSRSLTPKETAFRAKVMLGILVLSAFFWATGAIPIGIAALNVGVLMYFFGVLKPDDVAHAYAKDAVVFIFGVLAISKVITKTGLDRRIGLLLLGKSTSLPRLLFLFLPLLAVVCSFISEHALIAFIMPLFMLVYTTSIAEQGIKRDKALATLFVLSLSVLPPILEVPALPPREGETRSWSAFSPITEIVRHSDNG